MLAISIPRRPVASPPPFAVAALILAALLAGACGGSGDPRSGAEDAAPAPVERIENPALGIALEGSSAQGFELVANDGATLRLRRPAERDQPAATVEYGAGESQTAGVNLVDAVNRQKADIEARPDGKFFGQVQLMSQLGNAYSTRGRYTDEAGEEVEETRIFAVHPAGDRLLWTTYRYRPTPGAAKERSEQAMAAFGLIVPLADGPVETPEPVETEEPVPAGEEAAAQG